MPKLIEFHPAALKDARACLAAPERHDYVYLATKTFGINLAVRLAFAFSAVNGGVPWLRAALSMSWYQLQDGMFTLYSRTYLNVLGRASGALTLGGARVGDIGLVYVQLCAAEILNRLLLGPAGDTPAVWTIAGLGLVFVNVLQGMAAGGSIAPAISQARQARLISDRAAAHLYQLSGLTIHLGLLAAIGHQVLYAWLTALLGIVSWTLYLSCASLVMERA